MLRRLLFFALTACTLFSCEKKEEALVLPPPTGASHGQVSLDSGYTKVVYYDFETGSAVFTSELALWDLAFQAAPDGRYVYMNGGKNVFICNTHQQNMASVTTLPTGLLNGSGAAKGWSCDDPGGLPDSTAIRQWWGPDGKTKGEVFIVQTADNVYWKMRILSADAQKYMVEWAPLSSTAMPATIELAKDTAYNFVYYSFTRGVVQPEPPKSSYDLLFTQYRYLYKHYNSDGTDLPYSVRGALLNPYNTTGAADSTDDFGRIDVQKAESLPMVTSRDVIGFDWKTYDIGGSNYSVNRRKNYLVQTRKGQLYKMHFIGWYDSLGRVGHPQFEYQRLR